MYAAIVFLPLFAAALAGLFGWLIGERASMLVTCSALILSALLSTVGFADVALGHHAVTVEVMRWIQSGTFDVTWTLRVDTMSAVMLVVVTYVSAAVHVYSVGYMSHDHGKPRFFAYLSLFTFFMLALVTADNFMQLFFGWEGVGLCSYLLIGFWYDRPSANAAAIKAFLVNRVGDFGFALGIMGVFYVFDALSFDTVFAAVPGKVGSQLEFLGMHVDTLTCLCLLLFVGAMGKSAQLGLHTWLPDAMEGPTPVSALIHAATMVTAGVFMVCRLSPMFEYSETALAVVCFIGASTAIFAATVGLVQNDIKRVVAYSTCSQLGYMFFAAGVSAYGAAMFHLFTHAFFKALLFLGSGSVIHAMGGEQDMRKMGGIWRLVPRTYVVMWIGSLALAGIPFFAGYYSKDAIINSAFAADSGIGSYAFVMGILAATLTAFYSWRLLFMTFHGKPRADHHTMEHVHESPWIMMAPLVFLACGAVISGAVAVDWFIGPERAEFWGKALLVLPQHDVLEHIEHLPLWVELAPLVVGLIGIGVAWLFYIRSPELPGQLAASLRPLYLFFLNKWYFDELYDAIFVRPALRLGRALWKGGDGAVIDGLGPDGIAAVTRGLSRRSSALQTGYVYHYAFAMLIGVVLIAGWYVWLRTR